ncbi:hypothetical protein M9H77_16716 [Catharanthus roseus]|uniref:Uncharacterized protein n=1 Tax=Catharanthus roseus TaxID=4058 RepID=A0ACC0B2Y1_CATRO|nr:hypothetical protein M9H77_16716 [Catharanthus roseus]
MNERSIKKKSALRLKKKINVEEKERLFERLCIFYSISILSKESEYVEKVRVQKRMSVSLKKKKKKESIEEERKEKEVVVLGKSEFTIFFTNLTNSILASNFSCVQKFFKQIMENERNLDYHIYKTLSFFTPTSYLCLKHFLMETKLNYFAFIFYMISLEYPCTWTSMFERNHTMEFEEQ